MSAVAATQKHEPLGRHGFNRAKLENKVQPRYEMQVFNNRGKGQRNR